ncbi:transposable element p transposase [Plakobranchus ocellatus]|uniref:Transposable element p transposase n=1 Tax=Plakobranchus ocellatus TaxID=259542 RepID=A0AAV4BQ21_9GAST|nr:transposable element p transposase [Plakobranchus ocellatus]
MKAQLMRASSVRQQALTQDTADALYWTCRYLVDMAAHLLQTPTADHHDYECLGFFQPDDLEQKFGYFRMSAGCNFFLTVQCSLCDKTKLLLALTYTETIDNKESQHTCEHCQMEPTAAAELQLIERIDTFRHSGRKTRHLLYCWVCGFKA